MEPNSSNMDDGGMRKFGMDRVYGQVRVCAIISYHKQQRTKNSARTKMAEAKFISHLIASHPITRFFSEPPQLC